MDVFYVCFACSASFKPPLWITRKISFCLLSALDYEARLHSECDTHLKVICKKGCPATVDLSFTSPVFLTALPTA